MIAALELAVKLIKPWEGLCLRAYPDPASPLSQALAARNLLRRYKRGQVGIPDDLRHLSGAPWTIGYGETHGVHEGMTWTLDTAERQLRHAVEQRLVWVLKLCPRLHAESPHKLAACVSLAYNIGVGAFAASSVCRHTRRGEYAAAAHSFRLWNKAGGTVMAGLTARRQAEATCYLTDV